jgi:hypothetical protein
MYYIISVKHTKKENPFITLWCVNEHGYCYRESVFN